MPLWPTRHGKRVDDAPDPGDTAIMPLGPTPGCIVMGSTEIEGIMYPLVRLADGVIDQIADAVAQRLKDQP